MTDSKKEELLWNHFLSEVTKMYGHGQTPINFLGSVERHKGCFIRATKHLLTELEGVVKDAKRYRLVLHEALMYVENKKVVLLYKIPLDRNLCDTQKTLETNFSNLVDAAATKQEGECTCYESGPGHQEGCPMRELPKQEKPTYEEREQHACKVCGNVPDEIGMISHGSGCYTQNEDGGVESFVDLKQEKPE